MDEEELIGRFAVCAAAGHRPSLGIVGGTFDPIHLGHTALGETARTELGLDGVLYLPAGVPSFKQDVYKRQTSSSPAGRACSCSTARP